MEFDIIISYKRFSVETANNLYYRLTQKGYRVFFDLEEMRTDRFPEQIEAYIKAAKDVFVLLESNSLAACYDGTYKDDWFCKELEMAIREDKHIIPMLLKGYEMPNTSDLPDELKPLTTINSPKFDIVFFDAYIDKLITKGQLHAEPLNANLGLSAFKFYSKEDCKVYEGKKLIATVKGMSDEPFYAFMSKKGQYRFRCINDYTLENVTVNSKIDSNEEVIVDIEWPERTIAIPEKTLSGNDIDYKSEKISVSVGSYKFNMIRVEGGSLKIGATVEQQDDAEVNEVPAHEINVKSFYMAEFPVTQTLWSLVMGYDKSHFKQSAKINPAALVGASAGAVLGVPIVGAVIGAGLIAKSLLSDYELPVETISLDEARIFIRKLSSMTNIPFALPTEDEWEYAARGGQKSHGYKFAGGDTIDEVAWYAGNSPTDEHKNGQTHPVGKKRPNELGLYDMCGNVWEWTDTPAYSYLSEPDCSQSGYYIRRGGSWFHEAKNCRVSRRYPSLSSKKTSGLGLRVIIRHPTMLTNRL